MVMTSSSWVGLTLRMRSTVRSSSVCGAPVASTNVFSLKPANSTTSVSPSNLPTEWPLKNGSTRRSSSLGSGLSMAIIRT